MGHLWETGGAGNWWETDVNIYIYIYIYVYIKHVYRMRETFGKPVENLWEVRAPIPGDSFSYIKDMGKHLH